jgi:hypothetical protein
VKAFAVALAYLSLTTMPMTMRSRFLRSLRGTLACLTVLVSALAAESQVDTRRWARDGLAFDYPAGWSVSDHSTPQAQEVWLEPGVRSDVQIRIGVLRGPIDPVRAGGIVDEYVGIFVDELTRNGGRAPERATASTRIAGVTAQGVRLRAALKNEPGEVAIYWLTLENRFAVLTVFGPDAQMTTFGRGWDLLRASLEVSRRPG